MNNSYKAALLAVLGLAIASAAQAQDYAADPVLLGLNDNNTANDYVLQIGTANQFTQTAVLGGVAGNLNTLPSTTIASVFGSDANYLNNVNIGLYAGNNGAIGDENVTVTGSYAALQQASPGDVAYNAGLYTGVTKGVSSTGGASSWDSIMEKNPTTIGTSPEGSVSDSSIGYFMNTASAGLYTEQVYFTDSEVQNANGNVVTDLGTLTVNLNTDTWTFNGADVAVPEPTTYGLLAGGLLLVAIRRQFVKKNA